MIFGSLNINNWELSSFTQDILYMYIQHTLSTRLGNLKYKMFMNNFFINHIKITKCVS